VAAAQAGEQFLSLLAIDHCAGFIQIAWRSEESPGPGNDNPTVSRASREIRRFDESGCPLRSEGKMWKAIGAARSVQADSVPRSP